MKPSDQLWRDQCAQRPRWMRGGEAVNTDQRAMPDAARKGGALESKQIPSRADAGRAHPFWRRRMWWWW